MTRSHYALLAVLVAFTLTGCDLLGPSDNDGDLPATAGVYVANQGNFSDGNGSVTVYDPNADEARPAAIANLNSIVQGIAVRDTNILVSANSAARIDIFSTESFSLSGQITEASSPRYIALSNAETAYVTDQVYGGTSAIRVVDLSGPQPSLLKSIDVSGLPEGITVSDNRAYASLGAFGDTSLVASVNLAQNSLIDEIDVGCPARHVVADGDSDVFVFCTNAAEAAVLDAATGTVQTRLTLPDTAETASSVGQSASFAPTSQEIHVATDTGILRIDTQTNTVATTVEVANPEAVGAVAYDGDQQRLYVARTRGFTERGTVTVHDRSGSQVASFQAGIAPTYIDFRRASD